MMTPAQLREVARLEAQAVALMNRLSRLHYSARADQQVRVPADLAVQLAQALATLRRSNTP